MDKPLLRVTVLSRGRKKTYQEPYFIKATGTRFSFDISATSNVEIYGVAADFAQQIVADSSPFLGSKGTTLVQVDAGLQSVGYVPVYTGQVMKADYLQRGADWVLVMSLVLAGQSGLSPVASESGDRTLKDICRELAGLLECTLNFKATDKTIYGWSFTGSATEMRSAVADLGGVNVSQDQAILSVVDSGQPAGSKILLLTAETGLHLRPSVSDRGVSFRVNITRQSLAAKPNALARVSSRNNPLASQLIVMNTFQFNLAPLEQSENAPFYYEIEGQKQFNG